MLGVGRKGRKGMRRRGLMGEMIGIMMEMKYKIIDKMS